MGLSTSIRIYNLTDTTLNCTQYHSYQMYDWDDNFEGARINPNNNSAFDFEYNEALFHTHDDDAAEATFMSADGLLKVSLAARLTETHSGMISATGGNYSSNTYYPLSVQLSYLNNHQPTNPPYYCVLNGQQEIKLIPSGGVSGSVYLESGGASFAIFTIEGNIPPSLRMDRMASTEIMNAIKNGKYNSTYYQKFKNHLLPPALPTILLEALYGGIPF